MRDREIFDVVFLFFFFTSRLCIKFAFLCPDKTKCDLPFLFFVVEGLKTKQRSQAGLRYETMKLKEHAFFSPDLASMLS